MNLRAKGSYHRLLWLMLCCLVDALKQNDARRHILTLELSLTDREKNFQLQPVGRTLIIERY